MKYVLLDAKGVITDRTPCVIKNELVLEFEGAPESANAVVKCGEGVTYYRRIENGCCSIPAESLNGITEVAVKAFSEKVLRWDCESLKCKRLDSGELLVAPNDGDLAKKVALLEVENHGLQSEMRSLDKRYRALEEKFDDMMSGWSIT